VIELLTVTVPAVIGLFAAWRVPTLRRRVNEHAKLIAELPEGLGAPVEDLLRQELAVLARRDQRRLSRLGDAGLALEVGMAAWGVSLLLLLVGMTIAGENPLSTPIQAEHIVPFVMVATLGVTTSGLAYASRRGEHRQQDQRAPDPAVPPVAVDVATSE
jgi:hypothetical protein